MLHALEGPRATDGAVPSRRRLLVLANATCAGEDVLEVVRAAAAGEAADVRVIAPALTSRLRFWASDEDGGAERAGRRLADTVVRLAEHGIEVTGGAVGDADPLVALDDAVRTFRPDAVVIVTHPIGEEGWLEDGMVREARDRFPRIPITHAVVGPVTGAVVVPATAEPPAPRGHLVRDGVIVAVALVGAILGTLILAAVVSVDAGGWLPVASALVLDLGLKALAGVAVWMTFLRRPPADRLDA
jgi:hypothetical protein